MTLKRFCQFWIIIFSSAAIWLVSRPESWSAWGYVCGIIAQPAWFYSSIKAKQWGIVGLSIFYSYSWIQGIYFNINNLIQL